MNELENALASPHCIISVMGSHAGEGANVIFDRKKSDIVCQVETWPQLLDMSSGDLAPFNWPGE
jgi:hypothetical protein